MPTQEPRPTKDQRREAARQEARELREQQHRRERRNRTIAIGSLVVAIIALVVIVVLVLHRDSGSSGQPVAYTGDATLADVTVPAAAGDNGGIRVGGDGAAGATATPGQVLVTVYLDYMCPICNDFEKINADALATARQSGDAVVEYHPVAILDRFSQGTDYSTRASNAVAVVADQDPAHFLAVSDALFAHQPAENSTGLSDEEIASLAQDAGVPADVTAAFTQTDADGWRLFAKYVKALSEQANTDVTQLNGGQGFGTPTILVDGKVLDTATYNWQVAGELTRAIADAKAAKQG